MKKTLTGNARFIVILFLAGVLGLATATLVRQFFPHYESGDFRAYFPNEATKVVVYGTSWCKYCTATRAYLAQRKIVFLDLDVEKSASARKQYNELNGQSYPLVIIGNRKIAGHAPAEFDKALAEPGMTFQPR